jgi:hypothetical protein
MSTAYLPTLLTLIIGLGDIAVARGPGFSSSFAMIGITPLLILETGIFGFIDGIRNGIIGLVVVGGVALFVWLVRQRRAQARAR